MPQLRLVQVDAFADRPFTGNSAAVVPLDSWLPDEVLQAIAMENNLSETAYTIPCAPGDEADYELRWFTPTSEVALCGHATLASGHVLIGGRDRIRFRTRKAGLLDVISRDGATYELDLPATRMAEAGEAQLRDIVSSDGSALLDVISTDGAGDFRPAVFLSASDAQKTAILLFPDEGSVRRCAPDMARLREIDLMAIVTARAEEGAEYEVVSRVFVPAWGVDEDPVTGSAHAALAPFWAERLGRTAFTAWQASRRGGRVECRLEGDRVVLGGACVTVIEGTLSF